MNKPSISAKKTRLAACIAMALGITSSEAMALHCSGGLTTASSLTICPSVIAINVTKMEFYNPALTSSNPVVSGNVNSTPGGSINNGSQLFFGHPWTAVAIEYFDDAGTYTWQTMQPNGGSVMIPGFGTFPTSNTATYEFYLTGYQIAVGLQFEWNGNLNIPILAVFDCGFRGQLDRTCTTVDIGDGAFPLNGNGIPGTAMQVGPFAGATIAFSGTVASAVPIPPGIWLFGSGLVALSSVARRRRTRLSSGS